MKDRIVTFIKLFVYRFREFKEKELKEALKQNKSASQPSSSSSNLNRKLKAVYVVNKVKWYSVATADELKTIPSMVFDGRDMANKHRILQHMLR
jgi:hypothetical protein